jgi:hypothetical protein
MNMNYKEQPEVAEHGYVCLYNQKRFEVYAGTKYEAQQKAEAHFKIPKAKKWMLSVLLAEKDGKVVEQSTSF